MQAYKENKTHRIPNSKIRFSPDILSLFLPIANAGRLQRAWVRDWILPKSPVMLNCILSLSSCDVSHQLTGENTGLRIKRFGFWSVLVPRWVFCNLGLQFPWIWISWSIMAVAALTFFDNKVVPNMVCNHYRVSEVTLWLGSGDQNAMNVWVFFQMILAVLLINVYNNFQTGQKIWKHLSGFPRVLALLS